MRKHNFISFPKREWKIVKSSLSKSQTCSTVRCCEELEKYKTGQVYKTPWGDLVKIIEVKRYNKLENVPTWKFFDKGMKISASKGKAYGGGKWDFISFKLTK